jgi:ParB family chromosome partitioning protein
MKIKLARIAPNPDQPRKRFDKGKLLELSRSIEIDGLMQPINVRPRKMANADYEITAGERRWRASCLLRDRGGPDEIEAIVEELDDKRRDRKAIVENLQREDITPMEEARAYQRMIDVHGMTAEELAYDLGKQTWRITDRLRLLNLAPEFIKLFEGGNLSAEAVYELSRLESHADQHRIVTMINRGQVKGYNAIRAAVLAILDGLSQADIFAGEPVASEREIRTVQSMESKIETVARMIAAGFDENEVVIARKVAPDKARLMADKLGLIRTHCLQMENQLRRAAAQALLFAGGEA